MVNLITKLASALTSKNDKAAYAQAIVDMEEHGIPVVHFTDVKSLRTICPDVVEVTRRSTALILLSEENRTI